MHRAQLSLKLLERADIRAAARPYVHLVRGALLEDGGHRVPVVRSPREAARAARNEDERARIEARTARRLALRLELVAGSVDLAGSIPAEIEAERDAGYREATPAPPPAWARAPGRDARIERLVLAAGTRLLVRGGEIANGALRGDREHPLHLEHFTR